MKRTEILIHRSDESYLKMQGEPLDQQQNIFRHELMGPFKKMWETINVPITAAHPGGYDVLMASSMLGLWVPGESSHAIDEDLLQLNKANAFDTAHAVLNDCLQTFESAGQTLPLENIQFSILLGNRNSQEMKMVGGYSGFAGIPGYIQIYICPNSYTLSRLKHTIAHECNHQIRFCYEPFRHGDVSVGDYIVIEGLAESFAGHMYGSELIGPWVADVTPADVAFSKNIIKEALHVKGFNEVRGYLFGDGMADAHGYEKIGLTNFAGYAVGYHVVQSYLKKTGKTIMEATVTPAEEIFIDSRFFI
ncbi:DUF2268 domain-containing protein [Fictibacillus iocasae]|uniref:DUF2268 domain-containing protein n=1 Tax=Fictibacillus iocasae TaxID=2715437 RepID=A0ABW2NX17_9BACL